MPTDPNYVPTGGGNDPNQWQTTPSFGQTPGEANEGAGYNPAYWQDKGGFDAYKAGRRAYRANFQPGGRNYQKYMDTYAAIAAAHPNSRGELNQLLQSRGINPVRGQGMSLFNSIGADWDNNINGMYQYDQANGQKYNVATSDVNGRGAQPMTAEDWANVNRGFYGRIDDLFGGNRFQAWNQNGTSGLRQSPQGFWYNPGANGQYVGGTVYDNSGWAIDPQTGQRIGGGYMNGMGATGSYRPQHAPGPVTGTTGTYGTGTLPYTNPITTTTGTSGNGGTTTQNGVTTNFAQPGTLGSMVTPPPAYAGGPYLKQRPRRPGMNYGAF